jgi:hypothetical protein
VSMQQDELLLRTARYQIQYAPAAPSTRSSFERTGYALEGERGFALAPILSIRHNDDGTMTRAQARQRRLYNTGIDTDDEHGRAQIPSEFTIPPPPFDVTTECANEGNDETGQPRRWRHDTPNRIGSLPFESDSGDEWGGPEESTFNEMARRAWYRQLDGNVTLAEAAEASQLATQEAVRAVGGELMAPHARFYIERGKNKCTISFDPPVSGRFILLKMWNPHQDQSQNIDIQGVVAKGFAGPRYFPAVELR